MQDRSSDEERELRIFGFMSDFADPAFGRLLATELADAPSNMECNRQLNDELEAIDPAEWARRCAKLSVPVLVVEGMHDPRPVAAADSLVASLPNVRRETFTGSAHWPWLEEPARFQSVVRDWLRRLDLPPA